MQRQLQEILDIPDIIGVMVFNLDGDKVFESFHDAAEQKLSDANNWKNFIQFLKGIAEADVLFDRKRLYFRKAANGFLLVLMESHAPAAMVRLSSDLILPAISSRSTLKTKASGWIKNKFK